MEFKIGESVQMKKPHACGSNQWRILRVGADFRIECAQCGHQVMITRQKFEKAFRKRIEE